MSEQCNASFNEFHFWFARILIYSAVFNAIYINMKAVDDLQRLRSAYN